MFGTSRMLFAAIFGSSSAFDVAGLAEARGDEHAPASSSRAFLSAMANELGGHGRTGSVDLVRNVLTLLKALTPTLSVLRMMGRSAL